MNGTFAVARYTLLELSRRRLLLVFFVIGAVGIAALGGVLKLLVNAVGTSFIVTGPSARQPDPEKVKQVLEYGFVNDLIFVLGLVTLVISLAIGMTAIYHDLESGAAISIFSKPVSRLAFTIGKLAAGIAGLLLVIGLLSAEARLVMLLFGGGLEGALWWESVTAVANAIVVMLLVFALSTWMNNIVAVVVALVYLGIEQVVISFHQALVAGFLGDNQWVNAGINAAYWLVPHPLTSDAQREITRARYDMVASTAPPGASLPSVDQVVAAVPGPSGLSDVVWWLFVVAVFATLVYVAVRRKQV